MLFRVLFIFVKLILISFVRETLLLLVIHVQWLVSVGVDTLFIIA